MGLKKKELENFKAMLEERKAQILTNIASASKEMESLSSQELNDEGDHAAVSTDNLTDSAITSHQQNELEEINLALVKIQDDSYGTCDMCEEDISIERLQVKPHAKYCITCREIVEKNKQK